MLLQAKTIPFAVPPLQAIGTDHSKHKRTDEKGGARRLFVCAHTVSDIVFLIILHLLQNFLEYLLVPLRRIFLFEEKAGKIAGELVL